MDTKSLFLTKKKLVYVLEEKNKFQKLSLIYLKFKVVLGIYSLKGINKGGTKSKRKLFFLGNDSSTMLEEFGVDIHIYFHIINKHNRKIFLC